MVTTSQSVGAPVPGVSQDSAPEAPAAQGDVRVQMLIQITGTRNGVDWPPVGGEIVLPAAEAESLIRNSNARLAEDAPASVEPEEAAVVEPEPEEAAVEPEPEEAEVINEAPPERAVVPKARSARPARRSKQKGK